MDGNILGYALEAMLKELGCKIINTSDTATIIYNNRKLKLEKRDEIWYSLEHHLYFHTRTQIIFYMLGDDLEGNFQQD